MRALLTLLFAYMAFSVLLRLFALCGLLAHVQNSEGMLVLIARFRFDDLLDDSLAHILARFALFCVSLLALKT